MLCNTSRIKTKTIQRSSLKYCCLRHQAIYEPRHEKTGFSFAYAKTKTQISFAVTAKLISAFVFAIRIVQSLYYPNPKFQAYTHLLWLYSPVCVRPGRKPRRPVFSERGSNVQQTHTCQRFTISNQEYKIVKQIQ